MTFNVRQDRRYIRARYRSPGDALLADRRLEVRRIAGPDG
jgi:hypothetical protein